MKTIELPRCPSIHEARKIRDAEKQDAGVIRRTLVVVAPPLRIGIGREIDRCPFRIKIRHRAKAGELNKLTMVNLFRYQAHCGLKPEVASSHMTMLKTKKLREGDFLISNSPI